MKGKAWKAGGKLRDVVPPAANLGDPLPPESMDLREQIILGRNLKEQTMVLSLPTSESDERSIDAMLKERRARRRGKTNGRLGLSRSDSERLLRVERMLEAVLKKLDA